MRKHNTILFDSNSFLERKLIVRVRVYPVSSLVVQMQRAVKTDVTREHRDRGFTMETGVSGTQARRVTIGNSPDVGGGSHAMWGARAKGVSTIFYNSLRGDICPLILED